MAPVLVPDKPVVALAHNMAAVAPVHNTAAVAAATALLLLYILPMTTTTGITL
ncbi:hypothetical protein [Candidatus Magnetominusculus dajiuhuensis]|uniref:hypothetical protein n=1 Tax=Candidatus Magnetominusculus dajiuhuensis TaxID=3137712 RepID=UPI001A074325|nr:hypothetical protein [Nitrospirota bacterium]